MISYNPKNWSTYIFRFHKADTGAKPAPLILCICIYSALIAFFELEFWRLSEESFIRNVPVMHTLPGFAISMLLVFPTNTAYDRFLEIIAEEIEDPFSGDANDVLTEKLSENIQRAVADII